MPFSFYIRTAIVGLVVILFALTYAKGRTDGTYRCDQRINALLMEANEREKGYQIVAHTHNLNSWKRLERRPRFGIGRS